MPRSKKTNLTKQPKVVEKEPAIEEPETLEEEDLEEDWEDVDSLDTQMSEEEEEEQTPPPLPPKKNNRRWDQLATGKQEPTGKYMSWRPYKHLIITTLLTSRHDVSFTRRYLLYHHGVNVPKNVIHYYNSQCRTRGPEEMWKDVNPVCQFLRRIDHRAGAKS